MSLLATVDVLVFSPCLDAVLLTVMRCAIHDDLAREQLRDVSVLGIMINKSREVIRTY